MKELIKMLEKLTESFLPSQKLILVPKGQGYVICDTYKTFTSRHFMPDELKALLSSVEQISSADLRDLLNGVTEPRLDTADALLKEQIRGEYQILVRTGKAV